MTKVTAIMKYLSFDIECCNGVHMCEFGYVLYDENFNLIEEDCITINPQHKFNLSRNDDEREISLAFTEDIYFNSPTFPDVYEKIKSILTREDCTIIGFSTKNDARFLVTAYESYGLEPVPFEYYDFQKLYAAYSGEKQIPSIAKLTLKYGFDSLTLHKSTDDARVVILTIQKIATEHGFDFNEVLNMLLSKAGNPKPENARLRDYKIIKRIKDGDQKARKEYIKRFLKKLANTVSPLIDVSEIFTGKRYCIGIFYQQDNFNECLNLIKAIYMVGGVYTEKASECEIFLKYPVPNEVDKRQICVEERLAAGDSVVVLTMEDALSELGLCEQTLISERYIDFEESGYIITANQKNNQGTTLRDILTARGISLDSLLGDSNDTPDG